MKLTTLNVVSPVASISLLIGSDVHHFVFTVWVITYKYNNWQCFRCPGLVLDERPRSDVSDKYSWHCSNCKSQLVFNIRVFFFKIQITTAKMASHAVFVGPTIFSH